MSAQPGSALRPGIFPEITTSTVIAWRRNIEKSTCQRIFAQLYMQCNFSEVLKCHHQISMKSQEKSKNSGMVFFIHNVKIVISAMGKEGRFYGESYPDGLLHQKIRL